MSATSVKITALRCGEISFVHTLASVFCLFSMNFINSAKTRINFSIWKAYPPQLWGSQFYANMEPKGPKHKPKKGLWFGKWDPTKLALYFVCFSFVYPKKKKKKIQSKIREKRGQKISFWLVYPLQSWGS